MASSTDSLAFGAKMRQFRLDAGLTQAEAEKISGVKRDYIGAMEIGRLKIIYPEFQIRLAKAYRQPGYVILEAMGYETDCGHDDSIIPPLSLFMSRLSDEQQRLLLDIARATFKASQAATVTSGIGSD